MNIDVLFQYSLCFFAAVVGVVLSMMTANGIAAYLNRRARNRNARELTELEERIVEQSLIDSGTPRNIR